MSLPAGWWRGLTSRQRQAIVAVELRYARGEFDLLPSRHHRGYARVRLPAGHPYAVAAHHYWRAPSGRWYRSVDLARRDGWRGYELRRGRPRFGGWQYLHRYLAMSEAGRVLARHEHAHHRDGAPKDTPDRRLIEIMEEADHGRYHYGKWQRCGPHVQNCGACQGAGCAECGGIGAVAS